jgi:hypothetical protein
MLRVDHCRAVCLLFALTALGGCHHCLTEREVKSTEQRLSANNDARADQTMRALASRLGATLLPATPRALTEPEMLPSQVEGQWWLYEGGIARRAIPIDSRDWQHARLARRGDTLLVLEPVLTRRAVAQEKKCVCFVGAYSVPTWYGFVVEDPSATLVEHVPVNLAEDFIQWRCR